MVAAEDLILLWGQEFFDECLTLHHEVRSKNALKFKVHFDPNTINAALLIACAVQKTRPPEKPKLNLLVP
jgi:hypothetical protein